MKQSPSRRTSRFAVMVFASAVLMAAAAHAQIYFGGKAMAVAPAGLASLPAPEISPRATMPPLTLALMGPAAIGAATTTNLFAQVAVGGGYVTVFSFMNTGIDAAVGNLILTGDSGAPLNVNLTSPTSLSTFGSTFPVSVASGGSQLITASPANAGDPLSTGWASVENTGGNLSGVATFQFANGGTAITTIAGVLSAATTASATILMDDDLTLGALNRATGYAIANTGSTNINIKIVLVNPDGTVSHTINPPALNPLLPGNHIGRFVWQDEPANFVFQGTAALIETTGQPFSVVVLVVNQGLITVVPTTPGTAPAIQ